MQYAAANQQLRERNVELQKLLDATLEAWARADKVAKAVTAQRRALAAWRRDDTPLTRAAEVAASKAADMALAAWSEFEVGES